MAAQLHRVIEIAGFLGDPDFADSVGTDPSWDSISLPPYTRRISVWAVALSGADPQTDKTARGTTTVDIVLLYGGSTSNYTEATPLASVVPGFRTVHEDLPAEGEVWVRCSAINTPGGGVTHVAIYWEKLTP